MCRNVKVLGVPFTGDSSRSIGDHPTKYTKLFLEVLPFPYALTFKLVLALQGLAKHVQTIFIAGAEEVIAVYYKPNVVEGVMEVAGVGGALFETRFKENIGIMDSPLFRCVQRAIHGLAE